MSTTAILNAALSNKRVRESIDMSDNSIFNNNKKYIERHMNDTPVEAIKAKWNSIDFGDYNALIKSYNFSSNDSLMYFVNEILTTSQKIDHDVKLIIDGKYIEVVLYTRGYNNVTDIDIKLSKIIDEIFDDLNYIQDI
jgi:pterin-4a-carbinolamine dehydratase